MTNIPAFPFPTNHPAHEGMTLRDWFAGQALAGITGDPSVEDMDQNEIARAAYLYADAMLEARGE
jgi:hypothetical protein